jgi:hypothetical protein
VALWFEDSFSRCTYESSWSRLGRFVLSRWIYNCFVRDSQRVRLDSRGLHCGHLMIKACRVWWSPRNHFFSTKQRNGSEAHREAKTDEEHPTSRLKSFRRWRRRRCLGSGTPDLFSNCSIFEYPIPRASKYVAAIDFRCTSPYRDEGDDAAIEDQVT